MDLRRLDTSTWSAKPEIVIGLWPQMLIWGEAWVHGAVLAACAAVAITVSFGSRVP